MRLRDYPSAFRDRRRLVGAGLLAGLVLGLATAWLTPLRYSSETTLYVATRTADRPTPEAYDASQLALEKVRTYRAFVLGPEFTEQVAADAGVAPQVVRDGVVAAVPPGTPIMTVTSTAGTSAEAFAITRAVAGRFVQLVEELEPPDPVIVGQVVQAPTQRGEPVSAGVGVHLTVGLVAGLVLGAVAAVAAHTHDRSVRSASRLAQATGVPVLGSVPDDRTIRRRPLSVHTDHDSPRSESYRQVRTSLAFVTVGLEAGVIVVAGAGPSEGRSTVVVELAIALAEAGRRVVVVDTDLRGRGAGSLLGVETAVGLSSVLSRQVPLDMVLQPWGRGRFDVVTAGRLPPNPVQFLDSPDFGDVLADLRLRYDTVLLDSPPARSSADAGILCTRADAVVLVARFARSGADEIGEGAESLRATGTPVVGAVLVGVPGDGGRMSSRGRRAPVPVLSGPPVPRRVLQRESP